MREVSVQGKGQPFSLGKVREWLELWPLLIIIAGLAPLAAVMLLYPHAGVLLSAFGIIAASNLSHHPTRVVLIFFLVCLLLWSTQQTGPRILVDDPVPNEEQA